MADVPENLADLQKYFEPNFDAMLADQMANDDKGNPRADWDIGGTGLCSSDLAPWLLFPQTNSLLGGECIRLRHKEVQELNTEIPFAITCVSNKICVKGVTGAVGHKWREIEHDMISAKYSSILKYKGVSFPDFVLVRNWVKSPKSTRITNSRTWRNTCTHSKT